MGIDKVLFPEQWVDKLLNSVWRDGVPEWAYPGYPVERLGKVVLVGPNIERGGWNFQVVCTDEERIRAIDLVKAWNGVL